MPRPTRTSKSALYHDCFVAAVALKERNDCSVRTMVAVSGRPYDEVHAMFLEEGRRARRATPVEVSWAVLRRLGFAAELVPTREMIARYPGAHARVLRSVTTHHPDRFPAAWRDGATYILFTPGHMLAVVNGVNHDWSRGRALRATAIFRVQPREGT